MPLRSVLPIARTTGPTRLITSKGHPVWPVRSDAELSELSQLVSVFGATWEPVSLRKGTTNTGEELVWGLGKRAFEAARLYAHLTSRQVTLVEQMTESPAGLGFASVVVTTADLLTYEFLEHLAARPPDHPLAGIVVAADPEALHRQVLWRSAAAFLCGPMREARIDVAPACVLPRRNPRVSRALDEESTPEETRAALTAGAGLLNVMTHSDGIDAYLGGKATLCPMEFPSRSVSAGDLPHCIARRFCHRHGRKLNDKTLASFLVNPRDLAARLIVFHTCRGLLPQQSLVDPRWSLVWKILDNPRVGAIATTWAMILMVEQDLGRAAAPLQRGVPAGTALAEFQSHPSVSRRGVRMCLFGDPRLRLPAGTVVSRRSRAPRLISGDLAFLQAYMHFKRSSKLPNAPRLIRIVKKALGGQPCATGNPTTRRLREAVLDLFSYFGSTPSSDWNRFAEIVRSVPCPWPCPQCGKSTQLWTMQILWTKGSRRRMVSCPRCGFVDDSPAGYPNLQLRLEGTLLRLAGPLPERDWSARVLIDPGLPTGESPARRWLSWPAGPDQMPVRGFDIGRSVERWPMNLTLFIVDGLSLIALTCRVRA